VLLRLSQPVNGGLGIAGRIGGHRLASPALLAGGQTNQAGPLGREHYGSLPEGIHDGQGEVREITFVPSCHGEAVDASRGGYHGVLT
jgi:hypothetical protein